MRGVNRNTPLGIQMIQGLSDWLCPRIKINRMRCYQVAVLIITFLIYSTYSITRKPISVVKSVLYGNCSVLSPRPDLNTSNDQKIITATCNWTPFDTSDANTILGALDSAFLFSYAAAMFVSGMISERVDLRYFVSLGMLLAALFCYLFGIGRTYRFHSIWYYLLVQAGAGIAQTTGWPGMVAIVGKWFGKSKKGFIFGIWNSHTSLGNILGTIIASEFVDSNWALSFSFPGLIMGIAGVLVWLLLPPEPATVGLFVKDNASPNRQPTTADEVDEAEDDKTIQIIGDQPNQQSTTADEVDEAVDDETIHVIGDQYEEEAEILQRSSGSQSGASAISLTRAFSIPGVLEFSMSLLFVKFVSYTFLFWLPLYIKTSARWTDNLSARESGQLSIIFDLGGIVGAVLAGFAADWIASPGIVCTVFYLLSGPSLYTYHTWGASSYSMNVCLLMITGVLVNGPYSLITTSVSAELGTHSSLAGNSKALATVTAIIAGTGAIGAAIGPLLAGVVSSYYSWPHVFYMLIACNYLALLFLLRITKSEIFKLRQTRCTAAPCRVTIQST